MKLNIVTFLLLSKDLCSNEKFKLIRRKVRQKTFFNTVVIHNVSTVK